MGLAAPKNKTKIGKDPRNTFWSTNTERFGHKYLAQLGWQSGDTLGNKNSSYHQAGHITSASYSGVKIQVKDDTLGVGAKRGAQDECTGLLGLEGLLGRLNGNEKVVQHVEREMAGRKEAWITGKYGMRFVRGEVWKADDITKLREKMVKEGTAKPGEEEAEREKALQEALERELKAVQEKKKRKRGEEDGEEEKKSKKKEKKEKKAKKEKRSKSAESATTSDSEESDKKSKKKDKKEKKSKKDKKEKKSKKKSKKSSDSDSDSESDSEKKQKTVAVRTRAPLVGRAAIRQRFIAAKRSATMDSKSLNEILMVTA